MAEPVPVTLSADAEAKLKAHLRERIDALSAGCDGMFKGRLVTWRKIYEATPLEKERKFPWKGASNLVVPLAAIHCDTLQARITAAIFKTRPVFAVRLTGGFDGNGEELRQAWEDFLEYNALSPEELDLYQVENDYYAEVIRYGTSTLKTAPEKQWNDQIIPAGDGSGKFTEFSSVEYQGPRPEKIPYHRFLVPPKARKLSQADIKIHIVPMERHQLMERRYKTIFKPEKVDAILKMPDRTSPDEVVQQREADAQAETQQGHGYAEWDIYECHLRWRLPSSKYSPKIIVWYHKNSDTIARAFYDTLPDEVFVSGRLFYRDDSFHGYGMCEIMGPFQENISAAFNGFQDSLTVANANMVRADEDSKLHEGYEIHPGAVIPGKDGEVEGLQFGQPSPFNLEAVRMIIELAERRSGVSPPMQGFGAGTQVGKRGVYTAAGTLSLLQEGNRRSDLTIGDFRAAHAQVGQIASRQYAHVGLDETKLAQFGSKADKIRLAAELVRKGIINLPVHAASASVNKEIEKQNDIMLAQIMRQHYASIMQLLLQASNSQFPQQVRDYMLEAIRSSDRLMKSILRNFDRDDADGLVPDGLKPAGAERRNASQLAVVPPAGVAGMGEQSGPPYVSGVPRGTVAGGSSGSSASGSPRGG